MVKLNNEQIAFLKLALDMGYTHIATGQFNQFLTGDNVDTYPLTLIRINLVQTEISIKEILAWYTVDNEVVIPNTQVYVRNNDTEDYKRAFFLFYDVNRNNYVCSMVKSDRIELVRKNPVSYFKECKLHK